MTEDEKKIIRDLVEAARPFLDENTVDETSGTISLMNALEDAIDKAESLGLREKSLY